MRFSYFSVGVNGQTPGRLRFQHGLVLGEYRGLKADQLCVAHSKIAGADGEPHPAALGALRANPQGVRFVRCAAGGLFMQDGCIGAEHFVSVVHPLAGLGKCARTRLPCTVMLDDGPTIAALGKRIVGHHGLAALAQITRMHETKVRCIEKILDNAWRAGVNIERPTHHRPCGRYGNAMGRGCIRRARIRQLHPDKPLGQH